MKEYLNALKRNQFLKKDKTIDYAWQINFLRNQIIEAEDKLEALQYVLDLAKEIKTLVSKEKLYSLMDELFDCIYKIAHHNPDKKQELFEIAKKEFSLSWFREAELDRYLSVYLPVIEKEKKYVFAIAEIFTYEEHYYLCYFNGKIISIEDLDNLNSLMDIFGISFQIEFDKTYLKHFDAFLNGEANKYVQQIYDELKNK